MSRVLLVGRGFIGRAIMAALPQGTVRAVGHDEVDAAGLFAGIATVVHAGRHPELGRLGWSLSDDAELRLARRAAAARAAFVSLGTRKVYAPSGLPLAEGDRVGPVDLYGRQKLELEHALAEVLGPRLTRLRLANIFGLERDASRSSFLTAALGSLAERGEIRFDVSPFVERDFLPVELCGRWIAAIARHPPGGIVNVGSGIALPVGRLALWLIEGYGRGRLVVERPDERDGFVLDARRLRGLVGERGPSLADLRTRCVALGRELQGGADTRP